MKKRVLTFVVVILVGAPSLGFCLPYFMYDQWGGTWQDANKIQSDQSRMCWAAAAANVLAWTGWGVGNINTGQSIFNYYSDFWNNLNGDVRPAWNWWFGGDSTIHPSSVKVQGGGGFWPNHSYQDYLVFNPEWSNTLHNLDQYLHAGYGIALSLAKYGTTDSHFITGWGIEYGDDGSYLGIYVTDSNDNVSGLMYLPVSYNPGDASLPVARWDLMGDYSGWLLTSVDAFNRNPAPVPEPTTILLFGAGIAGLAAVSRKKAKK